MSLIIRKRDKNGEYNTKGHSQIKVACFVDYCGHEDCNDARAETHTKCQICKKSLGYNREFRDNLNGSGTVHESCIWRFAKKRVEKVVLVNEYTRTFKKYRLELECGHQDFFSTNSGVRNQLPPKTRECLKCKYAKKDWTGLDRHLIPPRSQT